jgi:hypothetical protein
MDYILNEVQILWSVVGTTLLGLIGDVIGFAETAALGVISMTSS